MTRKSPQRLTNPRYGEEVLEKVLQTRAKRALPKKDGVWLTIGEAVCYPKNRNDDELYYVSLAVTEVRKVFYRLWEHPHIDYGTKYQITEKELYNDEVYPEIIQAHGHLTFRTG